MFSIDCFKCISLDGGNRPCDDPFHNNFSTGLLQTPCMGGRKGRDGLFPATSCIKIAGYYCKYLHYFAVIIIIVILVFKGSCSSLLWKVLYGFFIFYGN